MYIETHNYPLPPKKTVPGKEFKAVMSHPTGPVRPFGFDRIMVRVIL